MAQVVDAALARKLVSSPLQYVLLDIDGVIWNGKDVIPRVPETLQYLRDQGKKIRFLSNNASVSRAELKKRFDERGVTGVAEDEIYNSAYAAALKLKQLLGTPAEDGSGEMLVHGNVFVVGERGLCEELQAVLAPGFITYGVELHDAERALIGGGGYSPEKVATSWVAHVLPPPEKRLVICEGDRCRMVQAAARADTTAAPPSYTSEDGISLSELKPVAVVAGYDLHFNMLKLGVATLVLTGKPESLRTADDDKASQALFIATNEDPQIPFGSPLVLLPGAGTVISALSTASGRQPDAVCGKPRVDMANILFAAEGITDPRTTCLMVGDRLTTDVAFGNAAHCQSMLVLSGAEGLHDVAQAEFKGHTELLPMYVADSLASLMPSA